MISFSNFGGLFLCWDWLFGTLYMPQGQQASAFGRFDQRMPDSFVKQLAWPFLRSNRSLWPLARAKSRPTTM